LAQKKQKKKEKRKKEKERKKERKKEEVLSTKLFQRSKIDH
jgi:ribosomal protein L12E/L44/L45/RPP1/RPP2